MAVRRPVSTFEQMFKKKVLPKKKQLEITDSDTVIDIATYRHNKINVRLKEII
jgi:hypothetical protein